MHLLFQAALFAAPYKSDFLRALSKGRDVKEEECMEKIRKFLINFTATVNAIYEMYNKMNADLDYTVWLQDIHWQPFTSWHSYLQVNWQLIVNNQMFALLIICPPVLTFCCLTAGQSSCGFNTVFVLKLKSYTSLQKMC